MKKFISIIAACFLLLMLPVSVFAQEDLAASANFTSEELNSRFTTGSLHSAYIDNHNHLWTWGSNWSGELFLGDRNYPDQKFPVKAIDDAIAVNLGNRTTGVIKSDHSLWTVGTNRYGELGNGLCGTGEYSAALPNRILEDVKQVSMGNSHSAAVTTNGDLYTWGLNNFGQLGKGTAGGSGYESPTPDIETNLKPEKVMDGIKYVCTGDRNSAAIANDGTLYMWGMNAFGNLGTGTTDPTYSPTKVLDNVKSVALGETHSAAVTNDGTLYMWGSNTSYQLGIGSTDGKLVTQPIEVMKDVKDVALGHEFSIVLKNDGSVYSWGSSFSGRTGTGVSSGTVREPTKILDEVIHISASNMHGQAVKADGSFWYWGQTLGSDSNNSNQSNTPYRLIEGFEPFDQATTEPSEDDTFEVTIKVDPKPGTGPFEDGWESGEGKYSYHEVVGVSSRNPLKEFIGWYDGDTLVSQNYYYYFLITKDTNLVAKYVPTEEDLHPSVRDINFDVSSITLEAGKTTKLTVHFTPENAENKNLTWSSFDPSIASVDKDGTIRGVLPGYAVIRAISEDGFHVADCMVKVIEPQTEDPPSIPSDPTEPSTPSEPTGPDVPDNLVQVYRVYHEGHKEHLYTTDLNEVRTITTSQGWKSEGVGWQAPQSGKPVYRLYSPITRYHLYTTDTNEVKVLTSQKGWKIDFKGKPIFYSGGSIPVYRLYHNGQKVHHLTTDYNEYRTLGALGWRGESVAFYATK